MKNTWTPEERTLLLRHYATEGPAPIAARLGRSVYAVSSQARRHGVRSLQGRIRQAERRTAETLTVNSHFFDTCTPTSAYVLGFIWARGSVKIRHRKVIRLVCSTQRRSDLTTILGLMLSRHQIQTYDDRRVVEICNSRLVDALLANHGQPPGRNSSGIPPRISDTLVARFARGYLLGAGRRDQHHIRWTGHTGVVTWLGKKIETLAEVSPPEVDLQGAKTLIRWTRPDDLLGIEDWLELAN